MTIAKCDCYYILFAVTNISLSKVLYFCQQLTSGMHWCSLIMSLYYKQII